MSSYGWGSAIVEGYLERHMRPFGKSKLWCKLDAHQLVTQKGPQRTGGGETYKLSDVQMVRKVSSDRGGQQFEMQIKNKTITFSALSAQDREKWVDALHQALMSQRSSRRRVSSPETSGYEDIDIVSSLPSLSKRSQSVSTACEDETGYSQITDSVRPGQAVTAKSSSGDSGSAADQDKEGPYASVSVVDYPFPGVSGSMMPSSSSAGHADAISHGDSESNSQSKLEARNKEEEKDRGYAVVEKQILQSTVGQDQTGVCDASPAIVQGKEGVERREDEKKEEAGGDDYVFNPETQLRRPSQISVNFGSLPKIKETDEEGEGMDSSEDELDQWYEEAEGVIPTEFPAIPAIYRLTDDDVLPFTNLKEFLSENPRLCRPSYRVSHSVDPVKDLQNLLAKLQ